MLRPRRDARRSFLAGGGVKRERCGAGENAETELPRTPSGLMVRLIQIRASDWHLLHTQSRANGIGERRNNDFECADSCGFAKVFAAFPGVGFCRFFLA
jgi:hypothetical protein